MKAKQCMAMTILSAACFSICVQADTVPPVQGLHTVGTAMLSVPAEIVVIRVSVVAKKKDALTAKKSVDDRIANYFDFLNKNGIEKKDIDAGNIDTSTDYAYSENGRKSVTGYSAYRKLIITLRQPDKLNDFLDGALKLQLNEIDNISFTVAHPEEYQEKVRQMAIQNAIDKAESLAKGFGRKVGPLVSIEYMPSEKEERWHYVSYQASPNRATPTYSAKDAVFTDNVEVVFSLAQ